MCLGKGHVACKYDHAIYEVELYEVMYMFVCDMNSRSYTVLQTFHLVLDLTETKQAIPLFSFALWFTNQ